MSFKGSLICLVILLVACAGCGGPENEVAAPPQGGAASAEDQLAVMERNCASAAPGIEARQAEATLFERVGGREGLRVVVEETVRRHLVNEQIKHLLEGVDTEHLVTQVTDFLVVATGGEGEYHGREMAEAHAHLELTATHFLAAAHDLRDAMEHAGWRGEEHQELLCAFIGLKGEVVTR